MDIQKAFIEHFNIVSNIEGKQIKDALDKIRNMSSNLQNWAINEKINELETNYKYMIHYLIEGNEDPEQQNVYNHLLRDMYSLADDLLEQVQLQNSPKFFFEKSRLNKLHGTKPIKEFQNNITNNLDNISVIDLMTEGEDKKNKLKQERIKLEDIMREMFYSVYASPRASNGLTQEYKRFVANNLIPINIKSIFVSALTMNALQRLDQSKVNLMLDLCQQPDPEIALRAIVGIVAILKKHKSRWNNYPALIRKVAVMSDDSVFTKRLMMVLIQYIQTHETEKITKKLTEEIIPEMMKLSPMIGKKINLEEWMGETNFDEKNPEWQKILDKAGLSDKLQEFTEMQLEGADVLHSTFSNLKSYPFFYEMCNWFMPFDKNHSTLIDMFSDKSEADDLLSSLLETPMICNSDKYSFCYSIMAMPEDYRKMMVSQLGNDTGELKKMTDEELILNPNQKEEAIIKQYIQDLYRFFKLYQRRGDFDDIFGDTLNYHQLDILGPIVLQQNNLEKIALYYFEKNNFNEALEAYIILTKQNNVSDETWQKIGYCRQMSGDIEGALQAYLKAELINHNNSWLLRRIAGCYRLIKQPESALLYFRRLDQMTPDNLNIQLNIGHCFLELNQYDEALNYYFKVDLLSNENTRAWRSIAWCSFLSGKYGTAQKYYAQIIENNPNAHDYINAGHVALSIKKKKEAVRYYLKSVELAGGFEEFKNIFREDIEYLIHAGVKNNIIPLILDKVKYDL